MSSNEHTPSSLDTVQSSPTTRFRDIVQEVCGLPVQKMVWEGYEDRARDLAAGRERQRRSVETVEQWEAERARFRADYEDALGLAPPLEVTVEERGTFEKHGVRFAKLLFASFEDNWIPGVFSMPKDADGPLPTVISACGHSTTGKAGYAGRSVLLARNGYAGLCFDLPGQGERSLPSEMARRYPASTQHNILGCKLTLAGGSLARIFVQDTIAAVTMLQQMNEVDRDRIGITGSSGGGWLSVHAAALDERIKVVVPAASVRSMRECVEAADAEQAFHNLQQRGIDFPDLLAFLICPRPVFIVANSQDIWPLSSAEYAREEAKRFYDLMGSGDRIAMKVWDRGHTYQADQFGEAIGWFNRFLKDGPDAPFVGATAGGEEIAPEELLVCDGGNVRSMGMPLPSTAYWNVLKSTACGKRDRDGFLDFLRSNVAVPETVDWAEMDRFDFGNGTGMRICYQPEAGFLLPAEVFFPADSEDVAILIDENDRRDELEWHIETAVAGSTAIRPDLRGWGETAGEEGFSDCEGWAINRHSSRRYRLHALVRIAGRCLVLDRVRDVLSLLPIVESIAPGKDIRIHGRRGGAWIALLAGLAERRVNALVLEGCLASFREVMECDMPVTVPDIYVPNLLTWGVDVPDLINAFAGTVTVRDMHNAGLMPLQQT